MWNAVRQMTDARGMVDIFSNGLKVIQNWKAVGNDKSVIPNFFDHFSKSTSDNILYTMFDCEDIYKTTSLPNDEIVLYLWQYLIYVLVDLV